MDNNKPLTEFFAITMNSVYHVIGQELGKPIVTKIQARVEGKIPVGGMLLNGAMLGICRQLQLYFPEGGGLISQVTFFERRLEMVNTYYWGGHTSDIVALCLTEERAMEITNQPDLRPCDPRWLDDTREVIRLIGENHPVFEVCRWPPEALLPEHRHEEAST